MEITFRFQTNKYIMYILTPCPGKCPIPASGPARQTPRPGKRPVPANVPSRLPYKQRPKLNSPRPVCWLTGFSTCNFRFPTSGAQIHFGTSKEDQWQRHFLVENRRRIEIPMWNRQNEAVRLWRRFGQPLEDIWPPRWFTPLLRYCHR